MNRKMGAYVQINVGLFDIMLYFVFYGMDSNIYFAYCILFSFWSFLVNSTSTNWNGLTENLVFIDSLTALNYLTVCKVEKLAPSQPAKTIEYCLFNSHSQGGPLACRTWTFALILVHTKYTVLIKHVYLYCEVITNHILLFLSFSNVAV